MSKVTILDHPVITHKLNFIRERTTPSSIFRRMVHDVSLHLAFEALRELPLVPTSVETPLATITSGRIDEPAILLVSVLRAGNGLVGGFLDLVPDACVRHLGLARDEATLAPKEYYSNLATSVRPSFAVVLDPMLATGGSAAYALGKVLDLHPGICKLVSLISAPEGIRRIQASFPNVDIVTAAVDDCLNERGYIVPGLGDAGDRLTNCR